ncbi:MAG: hypothetical protein LBH99_03755 [Rickettsia sp.]|nr:hypothetical protein [Rickettsia sp.]
MTVQNLYNNLMNFTKEHQVKDFTLEQYTFRFTNKFESYVIYWYGIPVGNAKNGLCGGMSLASILYYKYKIVTPKNNITPSIKTDPQLFTFIINCQVASLTVKALFNYFRFMFTAKSTDAKELSNQYPIIMQTIDTDTPVLVGLIRAKASFFNPKTWLNIIQHHQVVAYKYILQEKTITFHIYDPDSPGADMAITIDRDNLDITATGWLNPIYTLFAISFNYNKKPPVV